MSDGTPAAVIAAGKLADEMQERLGRGEDPYAESTPTPAPDPGTPVPSLNPALIPPVVTPTPASTPAQEPAAVVTPTPTPTPAPVDDFKHKYDVLQGKYNAEVPLLHSENARLRTEIAAKSTPTLAAAQIETPTPKQFFDTLRDDPSVKLLQTDYPDVWTPVSKALDTLANQTTEAIGKLSNQVDQIVKHNTKSDADRFYEALDSSVKDWESIQATPEFIQWASQVDRYTGITRGNLLRDASQNFDARRTSAFFEDYIRESTPAPIPNPAPNPVAPVPPRTPPLSPPASVGSHPPRIDGGAPPEIIKASEIEAFYSSIQRGRFSGTPAEQEAQEARYGKAVAERRVDPSQ